MPKKLWEPSKALIKNSNLFKYEKFVSKNYKYNFSGNYKKLLNWSVKNPKNFWNSIWKYFEVIGIKTNKFKLTKDLINSKFFVNSKLNFAENLLVKNSNQKAITFVSENGYKEQKTWKDLNIEVKKIITFYKKINISEKDRIAAYTPNQIETVECFLSASAIGSIWSSCSPDFGVPGVIERFSQIKPKLLIITDKYYYNGKEINIIERLPKILKKIKSIKSVLILNYPGKKLRKYIEEVKAEYNLENSKICLSGFSQGCMMSINLGLTSKDPFNCIVGFSGKIIDKEDLSLRLISKSKILLIHGEKDEIVPPYNLLEAKDFFTRNNISIETLMIKDCDHHIPVEASSNALKFIKDNFDI